MEETLIELRVEMAGGPHARYKHNFQTGGQQLVEVVYPAEHLPGDLCAVPETLTGENAPLSALLLGNLARRHEGQTIVLVGHTVINRAILLAVLGLVFAFIPVMMPVPGLCLN